MCREQLSRRICLLGKQNKANAEESTIYKLIIISTGTIRQNQKKEDLRYPFLAGKQDPAGPMWDKR